MQLNEDKENRIMNTNILVEDISVDLLREQRDELLKLIGDAQGIQTERYKTEKIEGLINLLDYMLDVAEGFNTRRR